MDFIKEEKEKLDELKEVYDRLSDDEKKKLNDSYLENVLVTSDNYYIELGLLKDMNIGKLIYLMLNTDKFSREENDYILAYFYEKSKSYSQRVIDTVIPYLPEQSYTQEDFDAIDLTDVEVTSKIYLYAPITNFLKVLESNIRVNVNHSAVANHFKKEAIGKNRYKISSIDILLTINLYPYVFEEKVIKDIGVFITNKYKVNTTFVNKDPRDLSKDYLLTFDEYYTYYFTPLSQNKEFNDFLSLKHIKESEVHMIQNNKRKMFSAYLIPIENEDEYRKQIRIMPEFKKLMESVFDMAIPFKFIEPDQMRPLDESESLKVTLPPDQDFPITSKELEQIKQEVKKYVRD